MDVLIHIFILHLQLTKMELAGPGQHVLLYFVEC